MLRIFTIHRVAATFLLVLIAAGCGSNEQATAPAAPGTGVLSLGLAATQNSVAPLAPPTLSDAVQQPAWSVLGRQAVNSGPGPTGPSISALRLTFDAIRVFPAGTDTSCGWGPDGTGSDPAGGCPFFSVLTEPITVDLFSLSDSLDAILGALALPEGEYTHLAVRFSSAIAVLADGNEAEVHFPSGTDRLTVVAPFSITAGVVTDLVLTFDVARSLRWQSPTGEILMNPVLHGAVRDQH